MAISDEAWRAWLEREDANPVILIEAGYRNRSSGAAGTLRASDRGYIDPTVLGAPNYLPLLRGDIEITDDLDAVTLSAIELYWEGEDWEAFQFRGSDFKVFYGDASWPRADFRQVAFNKTVAALRPRRNIYRFTFEDLGRKYFDQLITGNGRGLTVGLPFVFGYVFNARPVRSSPDRYVYYTPAQINWAAAVRDRGVTLTSYSQLLTADGTGDGAQITVILGAIPAPGGDITIDTGVTGFSTPVPYPYATFSDLVSQMNAYVEAPIPLASSLVGMGPERLGWLQYQHEPVRGMLEDLCASFGGNPRINVDGQLEVTIIDAPGTPARAVTPANMLGDMALEEREPPYLALNLGYRRNWALQTHELASSLTEAQYKAYREEYSYVYSSRTLTGFPFEKPVKHDTLIYEQAEAEAERDRRFALRDRERTRWSFRGDLTFLADKLGDTLTISSPDYGLAAGADFVLIGRRINLSRRYCDVTVWK